jgi:hypothetical protein
MQSNKWILGISLVLVCCLRFVPHPPNVTPVIAIAVIAVASFPTRLLQFGFPLLIMLVSDAVIGFHSLMPVVYGSIVLAGMSGFVLRKRLSFSTVLGSGLIASIVFFLVSNLGVWFMGSMYPHTFSGLLMCYTASIPFFHNTVLSTVGVMMGVYGIRFLIARLLEKGIKKTVFLR